MRTIQLFFLILICLSFSSCNRSILPITQLNNLEKISAEEIAKQVSEDNLQSNIINIFNDRRYSSTERSQTIASIEAKLNGLDYLVEKQDLLKGDYDGRNLVLTKTGIINPNNWVVIMAHYDTVYNSVGADDNASGCSALIEIARIMSNIACNNTLKLVFVDLEEMGFLGSKYFVSQIPSGVNIVAAISLEMIGYTSDTQQNPFPAPFDINKGDFLAVIGRDGVFQIANDFVRNLKQNNIALPTIIINPENILSNISLYIDLFRSDHMAFWEKGLPAIMITDTANFRNPNYHKSSDIIDTLDFSFMKKAAQAAVLSTYIWTR